MTGTGHGKLLYSAELGTDYFATNTNDPGVFPIDGARHQTGDLIALCGNPCEDDPETEEDESAGTCGGTHDKAYNPGANLAVFQCTGGAGYAFVDATTHEVTHDKVAISGSISHSPGNEYIVVTDAAAEQNQIQIWDTAAATHDGVTFDRTISLDGGPSARGTHYHQNAEGDWEAWVPQTAGTKLAVISLGSGAVELIEIGQLTAPEGARHFSRRGALGGGHYITYNDDGLVLINLETHAPMTGPELPGLPSRLAHVPSTDAADHTGH